VVSSQKGGGIMQIEIPDDVLDALRDALTPVIELLIDERVEQRRPLLLSITEVADELSCSRASVFSLIHGGHLGAIRTGRTYRVVTTTLQEYVEELAKPTYQREVVTAGSVRTRATRSTATGGRAASRRMPSTSAVPATRPPRAPRPRQQKVSKEDVANQRCTVDELAGRWWGMAPATALIERSGVVLTTASDGQTTFRYGELVEWMENNKERFHQWVEEFDPTLNR
jgi:excisionase family DNA binding protein